MIKVAITGGIGSGKSTVSQIIRDLGYTVFDCDKIANEYIKQQDVVQKIQKFIPEAVIQNNGYILDLPTFKKVLFENKEKRQKLDNLVHPEVIKIVFEKLNSIKTDIVFVEVPILFNGGYDKLFDKIILVKRDKNARIESVAKRSNVTKEEVVLRINSQIDYDNLKGDYIVIENNYSLERLKEKVVKEVIKLKK